MDSKNDVPNIWKKLFKLPSVKSQKKPKSNKIVGREYEIAIFNLEGNELGEYIETKTVKTKEQRDWFIQKYKDNYHFQIRTWTIYSDGHKRGSKHYFR